MGRKEFDEYIISNTKDESKGINIEKELREWKACLDELYNTIEKVWMKDYISKNKVQVVTGTKKIYEEFSGEYEVRTLNIVFAGKTVSLNPIGTMLVGAKGRVDLIGKNGTVVLILVNKKLDGPNFQVKMFTSKKERKDYEEKKKSEQPKGIEWEWKVLIENELMRYEKLDEDTFFDIIMELTNA
ncbi:hypothetical protein FACS1894137_03100 [Spirochaetia bacterium]|nr:hypothetical protein FACS1894137_03100 [Spirochaetia bacterium]